MRTRVFPELRNYCAMNGGIAFQPIDLRWGVIEEAQLDQKTLELCLREVRTCKAHPAPNFLILAGDRYGWIPLPYAIEKNEFETLMNLASPTERTLMEDWYNEDANEIPVSYLLKKRSGEYSNHEKWRIVETRMRNILQRTFDQSVLPESARDKYFLSATESEVMEGILGYSSEPTAYQKQLIKQGKYDPTKDEENVFAFLRTISPPAENSIYEDGLRAEALAFKKRIRGKVKHRLEVETVYIGSNELSRHYLDEFVRRTLAFLKDRVDKHVAVLRNVGSLAQTMNAQNEVVEHHSSSYVGRKESLEVIYDYICRNENPLILVPNAPLVVYGASGTGKSALIAQAIKQQNDSEHRRTIYRFIGSTPESIHMKSTVISMFQELEIELEQNHSSNKAESYEKFVEKVHTAFLDLEFHEGQITFFIDALDQLSQTDSLHWLPNVLPENVRIVVSVLHDTRYPSDDHYFRNLRKRKLNFYEVPPFNAPLDLVRLLLRDKGRKLQPHQKSYLLRRYQKSPSPLYIVIAAQELQTWHSDDAVADETANPSQLRVQDLADSQEMLVEEFIENLTTYGHHDKEFVARVFGYIHASGDGLSEPEVLQLLSADLEFIRRVAPQPTSVEHDPELPIVIWSRLIAHVHQVMTQRLLDSDVLITFFHREFSTAISRRNDQQSIHELAIIACKNLIERNIEVDFHANRWGKLYILLIVNFEIWYPDTSRLAKETMWIGNLKNSEWVKNFIAYLHTARHQVSDSERIIYDRIQTYTSENLLDGGNEMWLPIHIQALDDLASSSFKVDPDLSTKIYQKKLHLAEQFYGENKFMPPHLYEEILHTAAHYFQNIGEYSQAIECEQKSIVFGKDRMKSSVIPTLNRLSNLYLITNQIEESATVVDESLHILNETTPDTPFTERDNWFSLMSFATQTKFTALQNADNLDGAIALLHRSHGQSRAHYLSEPEKWADQYSDLLMSFATLSDAIEWFPGAISIAQEAAHINDWLFDKDPKTYLNRLLTGNSILAHLYTRAERKSEARQLILRNLSIMDEQFEQIADHLISNENSELIDQYVNAIRDTTTHYITVGQEDVAREFLTNRVKTVRNVSTDLHYVCSILSEIINELISLDCISEAIENLELCVNTRYKLYEQSPQAHGMNFFTTLAQLVHLYREINDDRAEITEAWSLEIAREIAERDPEDWGQHFCALNEHFASRHAETGQFKRAIKLYEESILFLQKHYETAPEAWWITYVETLDQLSECYTIAAVHDKARDIQQKSVKIKIVALQNATANLEKNVTLNPFLWLDDYVSTLRQLSTVYLANGQSDDAIHILKRNIQEISTNRTILIDWEELLVDAFSSLKGIYIKQGRAIEAKEAEEEEQKLLGRYRP